MPLTSGNDPYLLVETAQTTDTFYKTCIKDTVSMRLLSVRSQEAQVAELMNQDYAQVYIQPDGSSLCFCVCDGVGSSYKGDFAAQYLATRLVQWLQAPQNVQGKTSALVGQLDAQLNLWARTAQEELQQVAIPESTPALVREVLEELRDTYGSETVFLCGRIDLDTQSTSSSVGGADGSYPAHLFVCWMGNVTARLWTGACREGDRPLPLRGRYFGDRRESASGEPARGWLAGADRGFSCGKGSDWRGKPLSLRGSASFTKIPTPESRPLPAPTNQYVTLGGDDDKVARWSTLRGARGTVTVWRKDVSTTGRLIVHTDGLDAIDLSLQKLDDDQARRLLELPGNDDMTALELRWPCRNTN